MFSDITVPIAIAVANYADGTLELFPMEGRGLSRQIDR